MQGAATTSQDDTAEAQPGAGRIEKTGAGHLTKTGAERISKSGAQRLGKCALCFGGSAGGLLAGHAGCVLAPLLAALAGLVTGAAGQKVALMAFFAVACSAAITAGALLFWWRLRGSRAPVWERRIVTASALVSLAFCFGFHFTPHLLSGAMAAAGSPAALLAENFCGTPPVR